MRDTIEGVFAKKEGDEKRSIRLPPSSLRLERFSIQSAAVLVLAVVLVVLGECRMMQEEISSFPTILTLVTSLRLIRSCSQKRILDSTPLRLLLLLTSSLRARVACLHCQCRGTCWEETWEKASRKPPPSRREVQVVLMRARTFRLSVTIHGGQTCMAEMHRMGLLS